VIVQDAFVGLLAPTVNGLGFELLGVERRQSAGRTLVRLYIDSDDGIGVEDCETVSRQVSDVIDVERAIRGEYTLEVSSPGLDRPLFTPAQYRVHLGAEVKLRLRTLLNGRRRLSGELTEVTEDSVTISIGEERIDVPFSYVERARLVPRWQ
jgi:ribosome maturation factor RimP